MDRKLICSAVVLIMLGFFSLAPETQGIDIVVDYRYDTNHFFDTNAGTTQNPNGATGAQQARDALEAVANRYSTIITTSLDGVTVRDDGDDGRIGFDHPGTGASYEVSAAAAWGTDSVRQAPDGYAADEYRGVMRFAADEWVLYAGARPMTSAGVGGTGTGSNFMNIFDDPDSHLNRGFNVGLGSLPVWGGSISFDNDGSFDWHFDHTVASPYGKFDFYSIALHEVGHVLGLSTGWDDFKQYISDDKFTGANAVAALNNDNGVSLAGVPLVSNTNPHWKDNSTGGAYQSYIFSGGDPNLAGTGGLGVLQDLLMEPTAHFVYPVAQRFELTNIDVAALKDVGWDVIDAVLMPGDANGDWRVDATDAQVLADHWGKAGGWSAGDFDGSGTIDVRDAAIMAANWTGDAGESTTIPEPGAWSLLLGLGLAFVARRRQ